MATEIIDSARAQMEIVTIVQHVRIADYIFKSAFIFHFFLIQFRLWCAES